jgi:hypothetical protein
MDSVPDLRFSKFQKSQKFSLYKTTIRGGHMSENVEELTVNYEEEGIQIVKEIDKEILSKGSWTTILFRYQDYDKSTQEYSADKFSIRRYQKRNGQYQAKSKFNISSTAQAQKIIEVLTRWVGGAQA